MTIFFSIYAVCRRFRASKYVVKFMWHISKSANDCD